VGDLLFAAARNPLRYLSFIDFTIWANAVHGLIMFAQAIVMPHFHYKMFTDVAYCLVLAGGLLVLRPRGQTEGVFAGPFTRAEEHENAVAFVKSIPVAKSPWTKPPAAAEYPRGVRAAGEINQ
jgi:hypothetical protein